MKLPQRLSDLLHLRYVAGVRAKEAISMGMFTFAQVGKPECGTPGCLLGWLRATPEGKEIFKRQANCGHNWTTTADGDCLSFKFTAGGEYRYGLFSPNFSLARRTDAEELDYRLAWVDEEITRECIKQGLCPEETPRAYEHSLEREKEYA